MAFTHALYYPWINIEDGAWLKTAVLYWDKISTIVPEDIEYPYTTGDSYLLFSEQILVPAFIRAWDQSVKTASEKFLKFITPSLTERILLPGGKVNYALPLPPVLDDAARIYAKKMSPELAEALVKSGKVKRAGDWIFINPAFGSLYMSLLAGEMAERFFYAPLTTDQAYETITGLSRRDVYPFVRKRKEGEAILVKLVMDTVKIDPDTPLESLLDFRIRYKDELARFRAEIGRLTGMMEGEAGTLPALEQQSRDVFINQIDPALNDLKKALQGMKIRTWVSQLSTVIFAEGLKTLPLNQPASIALAGTCNLMINRIKYALNRGETLRNNPYSYIMHAKNEL